jgi:hypothetical protein
MQPVILTVTQCKPHAERLKRPQEVDLQLMSCAVAYLRPSLSPRTL